MIEIVNRFLRLDEDLNTSNPKLLRSIVTLIGKYFNGRRQPAVRENISKDDLATILLMVELTTQFIAEMSNNSQSLLPKYENHWIETLGMYATKLTHRLNMLSYSRHTEQNNHRLKRIKNALAHMSSKVGIKINMVN